VFSPFPSGAAASRLNNALEEFFYTYTAESGKVEALAETAPPWSESFRSSPLKPKTDLPFQKAAINLPVNSTEIATLEIGPETQKPPHRWLFYSRAQVAAY
jgi:hypothetical protein